MEQTHDEVRLAQDYIQQAYLLHHSTPNCPVCTGAMWFMHYADNYSSLGSHWLCQTWTCPGRLSEEAWLDISKALKDRYLLRKEARIRGNEPGQGHEGHKRAVRRRL